MAERAELAACVFAFDPAGRVLLVRSRDRLDTWEPPGGVVEAGEDPAAAAWREVLEETGLRVRLTGCSGVYFNRGAVRMCVAFYGSGSGAPRPSAETPHVAWMDAPAADRAIRRASLRWRWEDALRVRAGGTGGYAAYTARPYRLETRVPGPH